MKTHHTSVSLEDDEYLVVPEVENRRNNLKLNKIGMCKTISPSIRT